MLYLIFSILSSASILILFKLIKRYEVENFMPIIVNYIVASLSGYLIHAGGEEITGFSNSSYLLYAIIIGILLIAMFNVIALSTQKAGIMPTSVASKMSVVIPISFSLVFLGEKNSLLTSIGIVLALIALLLSIYKKQKGKTDWRFMFLPLILFIGSGSIDSLIKYNQEVILKENEIPLFTSLIFFIAFLIGIVILPFRKETRKSVFQWKAWLFGSLLGICNFGSIYFLMLALENSGKGGSVIFPINNIGVVVVSLLFALIFFKEKLSKINKLGIFLAVIAIYILAT